MALSHRTTRENIAKMNRSIAGLRKSTDAMMEAMRLENYEAFAMVEERCNARCAATAADVSRAVEGRLAAAERRSRAVSAKTQKASAAPG